MQPYQYLVFVRCFTYNQESYIEDALNGFAMQHTNFPYVVAVVDDASTDNNALVITEWISKNCDNKENYCIEDRDYGKVIQAQVKNNPNCVLYVILLKENHFRKKPKRPYFAQLEKSAKYTACCEGDDYWIDRHKLQKQVSFLENNPTYQLVFHNAILHSEEQLWPDRIMCNYPAGDFGIKEVFEYWQLPYASVLVRSSLYEHPIYIDLNKKVLGGWKLFIAAALVGKVYGFSDCMSVYRKIANGVSMRMTLDFVITANYRYAYAVGHPDAIRAIDAKTQKMLLGRYHAFLSGDPEVRRAMAAARKYNKYMPCYVFFDYILHLPEKIYRRIRLKLLK